MTFVEDLARLVKIKILLRSHTIWHLAQVLQVGARDLHLRAVLVHLEESLHLLIDGLHDVLWHVFALQVLQKLLHQLLLLVRLLVKVRL